MNGIIKVAAFQCVLLAFQIILYFGCECFQKDFHDVSSPIDDRIPFLEWTSVIYSLWFPLITVFPILLFYQNRDAYVFHITAMILEIVLSVICYLSYPTTFSRPKPSDRLRGRFMSLIFKGSYRGVNCAPSLHCSSCYLIILTALTAMHGAAVFISAIVAILIVISTMTTKQHNDTDVLTAAPMFLLCALIAKLAPFGFIDSLFSVPPA